MTVTDLRRRSTDARGFTLLEVMVALAILGLALSAILSAQAGMYSANVQARNITIGNSAARCKMTELEEKMLKDGYPEIDENDDGPCCDDESPPGVTCRWQIERVVLPDPPQQNLEAGVGGLGSDAGLGGGLGGLGGGGGAGGGLGGFGALAGAAANPASIGDGGIGALSAALSQPGANGQTGVGGIAGMAMTIVYPQLKPLLEASIRRITVEVVWHEGPTERIIKLVQFVTNPQKGLPPTVSSTGLDPSLAPGAPGQPGAPTAGGLAPAAGVNGQPGAAGIPGAVPKVP
jgi:general secretion pathway protein I